jgi:hypothetical protein
MRLFLAAFQRLIATMRTPHFTAPPAGALGGVDAFSPTRYSSSPLLTMAN